MRSDNGGNFVKGDKELKEAIGKWNQEQIHDFLLQNSVDWKFNPPAASHMGGIWERIICSIRKVLKGLLKEQIVTDEGLATLMCEVEAIINGRPLTKVSSDPIDVEAITPNHLLLLRSEPELPPRLFHKEDNYCQNRWKQVQYLADIFCKRWVKEYLPTLQVTQKWFRPRQNFAIGDIVLVMDQTMARNCWPLGKVIEVNSGRDGLVRSVKVKSKGRILTRPVDKLCMLEQVKH